MDDNAAIDAPRIPSPEIYRSDPASNLVRHSWSPSRHSRNFSRSNDALLRDLSPTSTLRAFTTSSGTANGKSEDQLFRSIESASPSERTFGARMAQTCKDIRVWHEEVLRWEWPGTFELPKETEKSNVEFWGSLPRTTVLSHERRVEDMRDALEEQDVEQLKTYVLNAHVQPKPSESTYDMPVQRDYTTAGLHRLDDFTALITATILQALPYLSRLNQLLNTWSVRLSVLHKLPEYLQELDKVKLRIDASWAAMSRDIEAGQSEPGELRSTFDSIHGRLGKQILRLGSRLDSVLDHLEGWEETLPDHCIDAFESLEAAYGDWVMHTERDIMAQDLALVERKLEKPQYQPSSPRAVDLEDTSPTVPSTESSIGLGVAFDADHHPVTAPTPFVQDTESLTPNDRRTASLEHAESPVLGSSKADFGGADEEDDTDSDHENSPDSSFGSEKELAGTSIPSLPAASHSRTSSVRSAQSQLPSSNPSPTRSRHVPIVVSYAEGEPANAKEDVPVSSAQDQPSFSEQLPPPPPTNSVRNRAAFLNRGIEQTQTLQKSPSPVRPFEHASQAFTKLFARANAAQHSAPHSRSESASSRGSGSLRRSIGVGNKKENESGLKRSGGSFSSLQSAKDEIVSKPEAPVNQTKVMNRASPVIGPERSSDKDYFAELPPKDAFVTPETQYGFEPSTTESKSTIESAWDSPALSDFPENWPLPVRLNDEEITSPNKALDANFFEKMFVDSLPASPDGTHVRSQDRNQLEHVNFNNHVWSQSGDHTVRDNIPSPDRSTTTSMHHRASSKSSNVPERNINQELSVDSTLLSQASTPGSLPSNISTPEVQKASAAEYFTSKQVESPPTVSRTASVSTAKHSRGKGSHSSQAGSQHSPMSERGSMGRRASTASIENHARSELKTINIAEMPGSFTPSTTNYMSTTMPSPELTRSPPRHRQTQMPRSSTESRSDANERSNTAMWDGLSPPPLNVTMSKRRHMANSDSINSIDEPILKTTPTKKKQEHHTVSGAEQLDRQVSRVLSSLPNRIRFTPAESDIPTTPEPTKGSLRSRPGLSSKPGLTLSPAQTDDKSRKSKPTDSETKLYHLSQEGKDAPIKLHVRLVGENERVMVRVGGGWADLGDYLRQYADHHGRRTISTGGVEVAGVATTSASSGLGGKVKTPVSRPGSTSDRPKSAFDRRRSSLGFSVPFNSHDSPVPSEVEIGAMTPTPPGTVHGGEDTPSSKSNSRPSTSEASYSSSPGSWTGGGAGFGLAGPAGKKNGKEIDQHKAQWVESMIERATKASVEKKKTDEKAWGDIGKAGGTRRVIFRNQTQNQKEN